MKPFKAFAIAVCLLVVGMFLLPSARADERDRKTIVTFSAPVEVPGVGAQVLPAGTYVFKILDSSSDRHIVQIFSQDGTHLFTTILAIPNYRLQATDKTVITFRERPEGQPEALKAWFYPDRNWGEEFVYAKTRAVELAKVVNEPVLATPIDLTTAPIEALKTAPVEAVKPTGETVELAEVVQPPPVLPQTASPLPLIALMGLLSLGIGFTLLVTRKRIA
jgi:LPXTG-motif cell wall-anchored protein